MEQIYDSRHSGQEVDNAVDAVQTTIPNQLTQIGLKLGDLTQLHTTAKTSAVAAINEVKTEVSQLTKLIPAPIAFSESNTFTSEFYANEGDVIIVDITAINTGYALYTEGFSSDVYAIVNRIGKIEITALHDGYLRFYNRLSASSTIEGSLSFKSYLSEQIDKVDGLSPKIDRISEEYAEVLTFNRMNSSGLLEYEIIEITPNGQYKFENDATSAVTAYAKFLDANDEVIFEPYVIGVGVTQYIVAPANAIKLRVESYRAVKLVVSIKGQIKLLEEELKADIDTTNKKIKSFISSIEQASATPFTITVSNSGISVTPKGYINGQDLGNLSPISTSFGDKSILVLKYYNSILSCEAVEDLNDQAGIIAIVVKSSRGIFIPYCANGVSIITETANTVSGFTQYYNSCVHASQTDFSWSPLLHAVMRVESSDTTKEVLLLSIKRGGSHLEDVTYNTYIHVGLTCAGENIYIWCTPTPNDTYEGKVVSQDVTYKVVVNKTMADYICPIDNTALWNWKTLSTPAPVAVVPYGIYDTQLEEVTDTHVFPGYIKDSEYLYKKDASISQMIPMTQLMVNHETVGASYGSISSSYYDKLYGEVYNANAKSGYGFRIVWGKIAFDGTTYDFSSTIDSTRYPQSVASEFLKAYRNKSKICFRFEIFSGENYDAYIKKPSSIPQVLQDWISENGYSWDNSNILVDSNSKEVRIGCPISVLVSMLNEGKAPIYKSTDSELGWYFDFTSDALYTAYMELHAQFSTWLDTPLLDENGEAITSTFYGVTKSIKYRDVLSELQFGLGIYSEGSIKNTPQYDNYPFSNLKRYYTKVLELFPNDMIFFANALCYDVDRYFTSEEMFEVWTMTNNRGRVGLFCDAIGANTLTWAKKLEGKFPFSGEGYQSTNYNIETYFDVARYFNVHSYHLSNFMLPGIATNTHTAISSTALRAFNIMVRLFGPHLWYQYLGGSSSLGWVEFTIENIGLHYLFDTGRKLYLILRSNTSNEVVYTADITSVCDVTSLVPKDWKSVGVPSSQNKYTASFPAINNCSMYLTLVDPNGFQEPFWFNNNGRNEFGEYPLAPFVD